MSDGRPTPLTIRTRLLTAGLSPERIEQHAAAGRLHVDGEPVEDLDQAVSAEARIVLWSG